MKNNINKKETVIVFGVFDIIHDGHRHFLNSARKYGRLIIVVAPDEAVLALKGLLPHHLLRIRLENLQKISLADKIVAGDSSSGSWKIIKNISPDIVAFGYDQTELKRSLENYIAKNKLAIKSVLIGPHADQTLHSSTLRKRL